MLLSGSEGARRQQQAIEELGGQVLGHYSVIGAYDVVVVADVPDEATFLAIQTGAQAGGMYVTPLRVCSPQVVDEAMGKFPQLQDLAREATGSGPSRPSACGLHRLDRRWAGRGDRGRFPGYGGGAQPRARHPAASPAGASGASARRFQLPYGRGSGGAVPAGHAVAACGPAAPLFDLSFLNPQPQPTSTPPAFEPAPGLAGLGSASLLGGPNAWGGTGASLIGPGPTVSGGGGVGDAAKWVGKNAWKGVMPGSLIGWGARSALMWGGERAYNCMKEQNTTGEPLKGPFDPNPFPQGPYGV